MTVFSLDNSVKYRLCIHIVLIMQSFEVYLRYFVDSRESSEVRILFQKCYLKLSLVNVGWYLTLPSKLNSRI